MLQLQIEKIIKKAKLSVTRNRKKVLKAFLTESKPLTCQQIQSLINFIDRVTLFRILAVFEEKKIIHKIRLENGDQLFALCDHNCNAKNHNHNHVHFQCDACNEVSCLSVDSFPKLIIPQYVVNNISVNVNGLCAQCSG